MKVTDHLVRITTYERISEVPEKYRQLLNRAAEAATTSYSPYSHYPVGAALLLESGDVIKGSNQENASFPLGLCAERTALSNHAVNHAGKPIEAIAITVGSEPAAPCGMCRQALLQREHEQGKPIKVLMKGKDDFVHEVSSVRELLPLAFTF
jgi:cytidine deaminase